MDVSKQFAGLPLGLLVCSPIIEVAKGQAELCNVYLETVFKIAYKDGNVDGGEANIVSFALERPVTDNAGNVSSKKITVNAPLLSLLTIPCFVMDEATVQFTMEVKESVTDTSSTEVGAESKFSASYWGCSAEISGSVTTKSEHTRNTDKSAKYDIFARAKQQEPAEGMAKLTTVFASVIEPISAKAG